MKHITELRKHKIIDIRYLPRAHRELRLVEAILCLQPGCSFVFKLNEYPAFVIGHLERELSGKFHMRILKDGPEVWLIQITRVPGELA